MKANKDIDAQVAKEVMGWLPVPGNKNSFVSPGLGHVYFVDKFWKDEDAIGESKSPKTIGAVLHTASLFRLWQPSINMTDAWQVVEKLAHKNFSLSLTVVQAYITPQIYRATFTNEVEWISYVGKGPVAYAICLGALEAVKENELPTI